MHYFLLLFDIIPEVHSITSFIPCSFYSLSHRSVEKISATLEIYRGILQKLFPTVHPDLLEELPREKLIDMITKNSPLAEPLSPVTPNLDEKPPEISPDAGSLELLQTMPEDGVDGDSKVRGVPGITDDVNALSLSVKQSSTYLGISSVMAVLRVIFWLSPESQEFLSRTPDRTAIASREQSTPPEGFEYENTPRPDQPPSNPWDEIPLINAYFTYVHTFVPLIDEQSFRDTYMTGRRSDKRWALLLNTVLALGSVAASTSEDLGHRIYYSRAKKYLDLECQGTPHLETVQALALLGGFYLHYVQQPNLANTIMGVAMRMSTTLGLHRDYPENMSQTKPKHFGFSIEMRRRIWWCLWNLDAWMGSTLGRPSMRMGFALTAKPPQDPIVSGTQDSNIQMLTYIGSICSHASATTGKHSLLHHQHSNGRLTSLNSNHRRSRTGFIKRPVRRMVFHIIG
jgi:hypothetical protein